MRPHNPPSRENYAFRERVITFPLSLRPLTYVVASRITPRKQRPCFISPILPHGNQFLGCRGRVRYDRVHTRQFCALSRPQSPLSFSLSGSTVGGGLPGEKNFFEAQNKHAGCAWGTPAAFTKTRNVHTPSCRRSSVHMSRCVAKFNLERTHVRLG